MEHTTSSLLERASGTTFQAVTGPVVRSHLIPIASSNTQRRIVAALDAAFSVLDEIDGQARKSMEMLDLAWRAALDRLVPGMGGAEVRLADLIDHIESGKSLKGEGRPAAADEIGVIKVSAMSWGSFQPQENKVLPAGTRIDDRWRVRGGDILLSRANTTQLVGASVLVARDHDNLILSDKSLRLVPNDSVRRDWLILALQAPSARRQLSAAATGTKDSMRNISQANILKTRLRLPTLKEQGEIVARLEAIRTRLGGTRAAIETASHLGTTVRRSLLAAAFSGRLVPQDPIDEPASVLLDRIRVERPPSPTRKRTARAKATA